MALLVSHGIAAKSFRLASALMGIAVAFILIAAILSSAGLIRIATSSVADRKAFRKIRLVAPTVCLICLCFDRKRSPTGTLGNGCQLISLYR